MSSDDIKNDLTAGLIAGVVAGAAALFGGAAAAAAWTKAYTAAAISAGTSFVFRKLAGQPSTDTGGDFAAATKTNSAVGPMRWVLGRARIGGQLVRYYHDDDDLYLAFALAQGECDAIERVWFSGQEKTKTTAGGVHTFRHDGTIVAQITERFAATGRQNFTFTAGGQTHRWGPATTGDRDFLAGISWIAVKLHQPPYSGADGRYWQNWPDIEVLMRGLKVQRPTAADGTMAAAEWTENAADLRHWWLRERRGIPTAEIDYTYYAAARTRCAEVVDFRQLPGYDADQHAATRPRYTINMVVASGVGAEEIEAAMDLAWDGSVVVWDGRHLFRPGGPRASRLTISTDDLIDAPVYTPGVDDRVNVLTAVVPQSEQHDWTPTTIAAEAIPTGEEERAQDVGHTDGISNPSQAQNALVQSLRRFGFAKSLELTAKVGDAFQHATLIPGDRVTINLPDWSLNNADFMVTRNALNPDFSVSLSLAEWGDDWYVDSLVLTSEELGVSLPPAPVHAPQNLTAVATEQWEEPEEEVGETQPRFTGWEVVVTADTSPHRLRVHMTLPDASVERQESSENTLDFTVERGQIPRTGGGVVTFTAWHVDLYGRLSPAATTTLTLARP